MKKQNVRSEYIKNLMEDKDALAAKFEESTTDTIKQILGESVNKELRNLLSESDDNEYEEEEVDSIPKPEEFQEEPSDEDDAESMEDDAEDDVWGELEDKKDENGEYDLTGMEKDDVMNVLKAMKPEDGVRVVKQSDGSISLTDDETEKEYIIDLDGEEPEVHVEDLDDEEDIEVELDDEDSEGDEFEIDLDDEEPMTNDDENDIEVELDDEDNDDDDDEEEIEVELDDEDEIHESLGYTTKFQKKTAMTTPSNREPSSKTYSMDKGVPTDTIRRYGKSKGNSQPYDMCESEDIYDEDIEESMTVGNGAQRNSVVKSFATNNMTRTTPRNGSVAGSKVKSTSQASYDKQMENVKRKATVIFNENKQLKNLLNNLKSKLEESIVVNASLGKIIQLVTENTTSKDEKIEIVKRFDSVKTLQETRDLYNVISKELQSTNNIGKITKSLDNQINENNTKSAKSNMLLETSIYKSNDLSNTLDLMERLSKIK